MIDSLAVPDRPFDDLRDEVLRRSGRLHTARRRRRAALSTAFASVLAVVVTTAGGPLEGTVSTPAGPGTPDEVVVEPVTSTPAVPAGPVDSRATARSSAPGAAVPQVQPSPPPVAPTTMRTWVLFQQDGVLYEIDPSTRTMRVAFAESAPAARWSRDGRSLALAHQGDLSVVEAGSAARVVFDGSDQDAAGSPAWLPDGRSLVFVRTRGLLDKTHELWTVDVAGGHLARLRATIATATPAVAPDGRIAYQCDAGVCLTDRAGAHLGAVPGSGSYAHLSWSPDGRWMAGTSGALDVFRPDGSGRRTLVAERVNTRPVWFADSSRIAFGRAPATLPTDDTGIWSTALDGSHRRVVVATPEALLMDARP